MKISYESDRKNIANYSNYFVTHDGRVFSTNYNKTGQTREMKLSINKHGYKNVQLFNDNGGSRRLSVHRLVASAFVEKIKGKDFVNHKDGNKTNNHYLNLEWVTESENTRHSYYVIRTQSLERLACIGRSSAKNMRKFSENEVREIRYRHNKLNESYRKIAKVFDCGKTVIERIVKKVTYSEIA